MQEKTQFQSKKHQTLTQLRKLHRKVCDAMNSQCFLRSSFAEHEIVFIA